MKMNKGLQTRHSRVSCFPCLPLKRLPKQPIQFVLPLFYLLYLLLITIRARREQAQSVFRLIEQANYAASGAAISPRGAARSPCWAWAKMRCLWPNQTLSASQAAIIGIVIDRKSVV